jgi:muramidase (phage lysozyme)
VVNLPLLPEKLVTSTAPTSSVSRQDVAAPYDQMAQAMSAVADATMEIATKQAKEQAAEDLSQQKVVRNADGSVSTVNPASSMIFGKAGDAYHEAVKAGTLAQTSNVLSEELNNLHAQHPTDPAAYKAAAGAFIEKYQADNKGTIGEAATLHGQQVATQHLNAITNTTANLDVTNQQKSINATIADQKNTLQGLARQPGGTDTPEFKQSLERLQASYEALGTNPLFRMPKDQIDLEVKNFKGLLQGEALVAHVDETFTRKGKAEASQILSKDILQNPNLSETDRNRLYSHGMARLAYLTGDAKEKIDAGRKVVGELETNIANGTIKPTDPIIGMEIRQAIGRGDPEAANRILAATTVRMNLSGISTLPQAVQAEVLGIQRTPIANQSIPAEGRALLGRIASGEATSYDMLYGGGKFQGYGDHPRVYAPITSGPDVGKKTSAAGLYQFLGSTWDQQAKKLGLTDFSPANQDTAAWDLAQTEYKAKTGRDLLATLKSGDQGAIEDVPRQLSGQWSSLPGGRQPAGGAPAFRSSLSDADAALKFTPQERALYQRHVTNLTGPGGVDNADGSRSTLFQATVDHDGKTYAIPTVWDGKILPVDQAVERVRAEGWDKFPAYKNPEEAEARYQKIHGFMEQDTASYQASISRPRALAPAAAPGRPGFTAADLQRNPFLGSAYVRTMAADESLRVQSATQAAAAVGKANDMGLLARPEDVALVNQTAAQYPEKFGPVAEAMNGRLLGGALAQMEKPQRDAVIAQYRAATEGQDQHHINVASAALEQYQKSEKNLADHPYQEAATRGWIAPVAPIDPSQPATIAGALGERVAASQRIAAMNHTPAPPVLGKDELPQLQAALEGPAGADVLTQIATVLRSEEVNKLVGEKGFANSLTGMMSSKDPVKMSTAMSVVDKLWRDNPAQAESNLGNPAITKLQAWQGLKGSFNAVELAERLNAADDPATVKSREVAKDSAEKETKSLTPSDMAYKLGTGWYGIGRLTGSTPAAPFDSIKGGEMVADYQTTYTALRTYGVDADKASNLAVERLQSMWGVSQTAGNQVMKNPPERSYPQVDGSHEWMQQDLNGWITKQRGEQFTAGPRTLEVGFAGVLQSRNWSLAGMVADGQTQAEIAGGRPPSYQVWITRKDGTLDQLPGRVGFNPADHISKYGAKLQQSMQAAQQERNFNTGMPLP